MTFGEGSGPPERAFSVVYLEQDEELARRTTQYLVSQDLETFWITRGDKVMGEVLRVKPDVIVLDLRLPGLGGFEVCRRLRERMTVPIIVVSARDDEAHRVMALEGGADDYVTKPFSPRELVARIRAHARRERGLTGPRVGRVQVGELVLDSGALRATLGGKSLDLTSCQFSLLLALAERAGRVVSRERLIALTHGDAGETFDRSVDVHVSRIRHKIEMDPRNPRRLKTLRGMGYMLTVDLPTEL
jgi:two-component system OmpR family response regulator